MSLWRRSCTLPCLHLTIMLGIGCLPVAGCAGVVGADKAPQQVWEHLEAGTQQDLIVVFDDAAIQVQAAELNKAKGIVFDDNDTIQFKVKRYAAIKQEVLSALPEGAIEILKNYEVLPLVYLRVRSAAALKLLLAHHSVIRAYEDREKRITPQDPRQ